MQQMAHELGDPLYEPANLLTPHYHVTFIEFEHGHFSFILHWVVGWRRRGVFRNL